MDDWNDFLATLLFMTTLFLAFPATMIEKSMKRRARKGAAILYYLTFSFCVFIGEKRGGTIFVG